MKIITWNVNGIRAREAQLCEFIDREKPDIVCLQELKAERAQIPISCHLDDYTIYWHGMRGYSGVSLHVRNGMLEGEPQFTHPEFDMETRIVTADIGNLIVASVYVPNGGKDYAAKIDFFTHLIRWSKQKHDEGRQVIICGDLNIAREDVDVHPTQRKEGVIGQRPQERELFASLLGEHFIDVHRTMHPENDRLYTWWAPWRNLRQRNMGWRIDYVVASKSIAERVVSCEVMIDVGTSDHGPVVATIDDTGMGLHSSQTPTPTVVQGALALDDPSTPPHAKR